MSILKIKIWTTTFNNDNKGIKTIKVPYDEETTLSDIILLLYNPDNILKETISGLEFLFDVLDDKLIVNLLKKIKKQRIINNISEYWKKGHINKEQIINLLKESFVESKDIEFDLSKFDNQTKFKILFPDEYDNESYIHIIDKSKYYPLSFGDCESLVLPYIISKGELIWFPHYHEIKVIDFLRTHNIKNSIIKAYQVLDCEDVCYSSIIPPWLYAETIDKAKTIWNLYYPILDQINTILGLGIIGIGFFNWLKNKFINTVSPTSLTDFIMLKENWDHHELAKLLKIRPNEAQKLLKGYLFEYDRKNKVYKKTKKSIKLMKCLSKRSLNK